MRALWSCERTHIFPATVRDNNHVPRCLQADDVPRIENHRAGDELQQGWEPEIQYLQQIHMEEYLQLDVSTLYSLQVLSQVAGTASQRETRERAAEIV